MSRSFWKRPVPHPEFKDKMMPEIAYTRIGRNALFAGLLSHFAALLVAMLSAAGAHQFFSLVYPFACLALMAGVFVEWQNRDFSPLQDWRFYGAAGLAILPVLGPLLVLGLCYRFQKDGQRLQAMSGLPSAILRLKAHALVLLALVVILFLLLAVIQSKNDPYFKRRSLEGFSPLSALSDCRAGLDEHRIGSNRGDVTC